MEWVETVGKSLEEAREIALDQLGVDESDAEFVIVTEPRAGLFGRVRGEARVRARVRPTQPRPKRGRDRRSGGSGGGGRRSGASSGSASSESALIEAQTVDTAAKGGAGAKGDATSKTEMGSKGDTGSEASAGIAASPAATKGHTARRRSRSRSGGSDYDRGNETAAVATASDGSRDGSAAEGQQPFNGVATKEEPVVEMTVQEQGEAAQQFMEGLVSHLGLSASVTVIPVDEETVTVAVDGDGLGVLVGRAGATLQALQELTRTYVQKQTGGQSDRILVDVAGYRAKRTVALQRFATGIADEVLASGEARALEPMSAADRKVVHDTVNGIEGVTTRSEGEDQRRHVVIAPQQ